MKRILIFILLLLSAASCQEDKINYNVRIHGEFPEFSNKDLILSEVDIHSASPVDTIRIDKVGAFDLKIFVEGPGIYLLKIDNKNYFTLIVHPDDNITVKGYEQKMRPYYSVSGSDGSELLQKLEQQLHEAKGSLDSLSKVYDWNRRRQISEQADKNLTNAYNEIFESYKEAVTDMIVDNPASLASLIIINRRFGNQVVFDEQYDFYYYAIIDSGLMEKYPENKHVADHHERVEKIRFEQAARERSEKRMAPGRPAPDFELETPGGEPVSLASLKGKTVLLYFWASYDALSRKANQELVTIYKKYKRAGFEIYAVSLDSYKEMWEDAIGLDQLDWINVSDLQNIYSPAVFLYQVPEKLPYFYLLDPDQIIMMRSNNLEKVKTALRKQFE